MAVADHRGASDRRLAARDDGPSRADLRALSRASRSAAATSAISYRAASSKCSRSRRALVVNPSLLLLDEPMEGLAPIIVQELVKVIRSLIDDGGMAVVIVEQHAKLALSLTRQTVVLDRGRIVHRGSSEDLLERSGNAAPVGGGGVTLHDRSGTGAYRPVARAPEPARHRFRTTEVADGEQVTLARAHPAVNDQASPLRV